LRDALRTSLISDGDILTDTGIDFFDDVAILSSVL
jgi:hypothetical protein